MNSDLQRYRWMDFREALLAMLPSDPPLLWDVPSFTVAREYASRLAKGRAHRYKVELVRRHDHESTMMRVSVTMIERDAQ